MNNLTKSIIILAVDKMLAYEGYEIKDGILYLKEVRNGLTPESIVIAGYEKTVLKTYKKLKEEREQKCQVK